MQKQSQCKGCMLHSRVSLSAASIWPGYTLSAVYSVENVCLDADGAFGWQIKKETGPKVLPQNTGCAAHVCLPGNWPRTVCWGSGVPQCLHSSTYDCGPPGLSWAYMLAAIDQPPQTVVINSPADLGGFGKRSSQKTDMFCYALCFKSKGSGQ